MIPALDALFGNRTAAALLLYIANYGSVYAKQAADNLELNLSAVQNQLERLEAAGVLVSRTVGRTRVFEFNPREPSVARLKDYLDDVLDLLPESLIESRFRERRRPRRSGKPLDKLSAKQ